MNLQQTNGDYPCAEISLEAFMLKQIRELKELGRLKTAVNYETTLRSFRNFRNRQFTAWHNLDMSLLQHYEHWLKQRGLSLNTISFYMRVLRAVFNRAVQQELIPPAQPFRRVYTGIEKTSKRAVDDRVIKRLLQLSLDGSLAFARDLFLFSFYTRGMAFIDIAYLSRKNISNGYLHYYRHKTGKLLFIKLERCMCQIIDQYASVGNYFLFPILNAEANNYSSALRIQNIRLKQISCLLKLPVPLTTYVARHSWASLAKKKGVPLSVISESMGHESEETTRIYLASLDQSVLDEANRKLLKHIHRFSSSY